MEINTIAQRIKQRPVFDEAPNRNVEAVLERSKKSVTCAAYVAYYGETSPSRGTPIEKPMNNHTMLLSSLLEVEAISSWAMEGHRMRRRGAGGKEGDWCIAGQEHTEVCTEAGEFSFRNEQSKRVYI